MYSWSWHAFRFCFFDLFDIRCDLPHLRRMSLPVPVTLKRARADLLDLSLGMVVSRSLSGSGRAEKMRYFGISVKDNLCPSSFGGFSTLVMSSSALMNLSMVARPNSWC